MGRLAIMEYNSSCFRYLLVQHNSPFRPDIHPIYAEVGAFHEDYYEQRNEDRIAEREVVLKEQITDHALLSGRIDIVFTDGSFGETKATLSKTARREVIRKGNFKLSHLTQVVTYMIFSEVQKGSIIVGYYEQTEAGEWKLCEERTFEVTIDNDGEILVDGKKTTYNVQNVLKFIYKQADILHNRKVVKHRPMGLNPFNSPCKFCPLKDVCDKYDTCGMEDEDFIDEGIEALKKVIPNEPKISIYKPKRRKHGKRRST